MIKIKQTTANVWEHTNGNIVNIAIIVNVVHFLKTSIRQIQKVTDSFTLNVDLMERNFDGTKQEH